jgi:hypothetical protein
VPALLDVSLGGLGILDQCRLGHRLAGILEPFLELPLALLHQGETLGEDLRLVREP